MVHGRTSFENGGREKFERERLITALQNAFTSAAQDEPLCSFSLTNLELFGQGLAELGISNENGSWVVLLSCVNYT